MTDLAAAAAAELRALRIPSRPGLTERELARVERKFGFTFADDHRALLAELVPIGQGWVDWKHDDETIRDRLDAPLEGVLFDVANGVFWPEEWGVRPDGDAEAEQVARGEFASWPTLVPLYAHRRMPAGAPTGAPVFSVMQTDVIAYGADLLDYVRTEFGGQDLSVPASRSSGYGMWSRLAAGEFA